MLIRPFIEILNQIYTSSFKKMYWKMSSGKWRPFCLGLNVLRKAYPCHDVSLCNIIHGILHTSIFSNAFDLIRVRNLRRMNSYTDEMFRETFIMCCKSNVYEMVVFDWSGTIIVTSVLTLSLLTLSTLAQVMAWDYRTLTSFVVSFVVEF